MAPSSVSLHIRIGGSQVIAEVLPNAKPISSTEIQRQAQERSRRLCASHIDLRAILERHEATIQKRWIKKTKTQRQSILLKAWPNMATTHRPDFEILKKEVDRNTESISISLEHRDAFIWPYINQEDLTKPKTLPLLLNARGRHDPCDFAAADGEAMRLGIGLDVVTFSRVTSHIMMLNGVVGSDLYGAVLPLTEFPELVDVFFNRRQFLPGKGLIILEAQERLLSFLVSCCKQILHEIPEDILASNVFPVQPIPQLKTEADTSGFNSLAIMAAEAPYRVPEHLDFGRIESLLAAQASAAKDHVWSLREDPAYFAGTQLEVMEHRLEQIKDMHGRSHPGLKKPKHCGFWTGIMSNLLWRAYISLESFSELQRQAQQLRALQNKYAPVLSPTDGLPEVYLGAILKFRQHLREAAKVSLAQLTSSFCASPPLRKHFVCDPAVDVQSKAAFRTTMVSNKLNKVERKLMWLVDKLSDIDDHLFHTRMPILVDELERLLDSEQTAKELVTPHIASVLGEISIISQCYTQLELYQPWANGFEVAEEQYKDDIKEEWQKTAKQWASITNAIQKQNLVQAVKLGDLSGGRFTYPIDKRRTKENTETLRQSEANLDAFWASIDELVHSKAGELKDTAIGRLLSQPRIIQRTPEWVDPIKMPKNPEVASSTESKAGALYKPLSELYFGLEPRNPDGPEVVLAKTKVKTKTRGPANHASISAEDDTLEDPSPPDPQPTIPVDARALKAFRTLFFNPSPTATPGEISWNDFLHALTSTGFTAEKLYGSVWQFRPTTLEVNRSIQFHEPHPSGKIPFWVARRHGRRLNRAYGWVGDMFTLKEK